MGIQSIIVGIHILVSLLLIGLILIQRGKGAEAGAAFGGGASQTVFGSRGSASFLTRVTAGLAMTFFVTSLTLAYFTQQSTQKQSVTEVMMPAAPMQGNGVSENKLFETIRSDVPAVPVANPDSN